MLVLNKVLTFPRNLIFLFTLGCLVIASVTPVSVAAQEAAISDRQISLEGQARLAQLMLAAADHANRTGDEAVFRQLSGNNFQISNIDAEIEAGFGMLRENGVDPAPFIQHPVRWKGAPVIEEGKLRLLGTLLIAAVQTGFDMSWHLEDGFCRLTAISITLSPV